MTISVDLHASRLVISGHHLGSGSFSIRSGFSSIRFSGVVSETGHSMKQIRLHLEHLPKDTPVFRRLQRLFFPIMQCYLFHRIETAITDDLCQSANSPSPTAPQPTTNLSPPREWTTIGLAFPKGHCMEVLLGQFKRSLIDSGLMTADEVEAFIDSLPSDIKPKDGKALAQILVKQKKLTKFQAQAIFQGKTKGLIMGDYIVLDRIGEGGMGQVYEARHKVMKRVVALKTLPAAATKLEAAVKRFHREVEVAARLSHPNIVTAHDAGEAHGTHYLVMELVEGDDLANHVRQHGRLPVQTALDYTLQAAKGLEYAHAKQVVHRDVKPSNLLLDKEGTVKVLDMGLARLNEAIGPDDSTGQQTLTGTGQAMGTVDFMPPEQAENVKEADERSDIYSLGCTLYYLLTGRAVYGGDTTIMRLLAHHTAEIPSLRAERPDVPEHLDAVFQKMVAKKPDDRYGSMTEVIVELQKCGGPRPDNSTGPPDLSNAPLASANAETQALLKSEETPGDESLMLGLPVVSPVEALHRRLPKKDKKQQIIIGSAAAIIGFFALLFGVIFMLRTPEGTLVVEINQSDAVVQVLDEEGKVEIERKGEKGKLSISVDPGKHRLKVEKDGFSLFTEAFEMESGGEKAIRARLEPVASAVASKPVTLPSAVGQKPVPPKSPEPSRPSGSTEAPPLAIAPFTPAQAKQHQQRWAQYLGIPAVETNSIGMQMTLIPPGEFLMGSSEEEIEALLKEGERQGWPKELYTNHIRTEVPQHKVRITKPFHLTAHEVTVGQFKAFVETTAYKTEAETDGNGKNWRNPGFAQSDDDPAVFITWHDATSFCKWLGTIDKEDYRLPTEAEWEYACRAGSTAHWSFGDNEASYEKYAWYDRKKWEYFSTHPVGQKLPNAFGLFDMHGNIREWCSDWFDSRFYRQSPVEDPTGPPNGTGRVIRDGASYYKPQTNRCACRAGQVPEYKYLNVGFRLARSCH